MVSVRKKILVPAAIVLGIAFIFLPSAHSKSTASDVLSIRIPHKNATFDRRNDFARAVLEASIQAAGEKVQLVTSLKDIEQAELFEALGKSSRNGLDVVWAVSNPDRMKNHLMIYAPILEDLIGLRIPLVRKDKLKQLSNIRTLKQLKKVKIVQVQDWPDTQILTENGLNVCP